MTLPEGYDLKSVAAGVLVGLGPLDPRCGQHDNAKVFHEYRGEPRGYLQPQLKSSGPFLYVNQNDRPFRTARQATAPNTNTRANIGEMTNCITNYRSSGIEPPFERP